MNTDSPLGRETPKTLPARLAETLEPIGVSRKKAFEYLAMFVVLGITYYCELMRGWKQSACSPDQVILFAELPVILLKCFIFTAWPFALVAGLDPTWRSKDAGNVFLAACIAANVLWFHKTGCGFCVFAAVFRVIPLVFCAMIAHGLGTWRHRLRLEE